MRNITVVLTVCLMVVLTLSTGYSADITSAGSGNWSSTGTWVGGAVPLATDNVIIADGHTVTIDGNVAAASITVGQGTSGILTFDATTNREVIISGNVTVSAGGSFIVFPALTPTGDVTAASNVVTNVSSTAGISNFWNISGTGITTGSTISAFDATTITMSLAATISGTAVPLSIKPTIKDSIYIGGNLTNNGKFDMSLGSSSTVCMVIFNNTTGNQTISGAGDTTRFRGVTLAKGAVGNKVICNRNVSMANTNITFTAGTWEQTAGRLTTTSGSIAIGGPAVPSAALNIIGTGSAVVASNVNVYGTLLVNTSDSLIVGTGAGKIDATFLAGAVTTFTSGTVVVYGKIALAALTNTTVNGANIIVDPKGFAATDYAFRITTGTGGTNPFTFTSGTITILNGNSFAGANPELAMSSSIAPNISGTAKFILGQGASTTGANGFRINLSSLNLLNHLTINTGSVGVTLQSSVVVKGTASFISNGTLTPATFSLRYGATSGAQTGTLEYKGTSPQTTTDFECISSSGYRAKNIIINNAAGVTLHADRTVPGDLTLTSGTLADGGFTLTVNGNIANNAAHSGAGRIRLYGGTASHTLSGTGTYGNVELIDTYGASLTGNTVVNGTLTLTGGTLTNGAFLTFGNNASIIKISGSLTAAPAFGTPTNLTYGKSYSTTGSFALGSNLDTLGTIYPVGFEISGAGIPPGTTIIAISGNVATMSQNATASGTAVPLTITWPNVITTGFELPASSSALGNLTINNAAGAALGASPTVNGTLTLTLGTLAVGANTLSLNGPAIAGTPANLGTTSSSSLSFGGSSSSVAIPSSVTALNNLAINNSNGVTLGGNATVSGTLTLTSGNLNLNGNSLAFTSLAGTNGTVSQTVPLNAPSAVDVGGLGLVITSSADLGSTTVTRGVSPQSGGGNLGISRWYDIVPTNNTGLDAIMVFHYAESELNGIPESQLALFRSTNGGTAWALEGGAVDEGKNTITLSHVAGFSRWTAADIDLPLPIQLASFTANALDNHSVRLTWTTLSEMNNFGFYIQKRLQGEFVWNEIPNSFVPGHGTTNEPQHYSFTDNIVSAGTWQYRLKQVDLDGSVHYSEPVQVDVLTSVKESAPMEFALHQNYPNPFNPSTEIKFSVGLNGLTTLKIYNLLGQEVATLFNDVAEAGQYYRLKLDARNLSSGTYLYRLQSGEKSEIKRLLLLK